MRSSRGTRTTRALNRMVGAGVAGVAVVAVLVGCTSERGPEPSAPETTVASTAEPTPTPTPTPTELVAPETVKPERPDAMDEVSVEGAEAVARYFLELYPYVYATGDLTEWKRLSDEECAFCSSVVDNVEAQMAAGDRSEGAEVTIVQANAQEISSTRYGATLQVRQGPSATYDSSGEVVDEKTETTEHTMTLALEHREEWRVLAVQVDEAPD